MRWLDTNHGALTKLTGLSDFALSGFVATSHRVPMQFLPEGEATVFLDFNLLDRRFRPH